MYVGIFQALPLLITLTRHKPFSGLFGHMSNIIRLEALRLALQA